MLCWSSGMEQVPLFVITEHQCPTWNVQVLESVDQWNGGHPDLLWEFAL